MKDIIFADRPRVNGFEKHVQTHLRLNKLEEMKKSIRSASTIQSAIQILIEKFGREDLLGIVQAIREVFQVGNEQIGRYL
jgi:hypothetical protein